VTLTLASAQCTKVAVSDNSGSFRFPFLTPGSYKLTATLQGFNSVERSGIDVRLNSRVRLEVVLSPGASETIDVIGTAPVVDLSTATTGATISSDLMKSVPVGRTFADTLALAPGVVDSGIDASNPSVGGASGLENAYVVDGVNIGNTGYGSAGSYSIVFGSLGTGVNFDYIEEVQVKTGGYEPEFGEALGGYINLVTKSGGNELKGSGFVYYQPEWAEGEREPFDLIANSQGVGSDNQSREIREADVGFDIGGPVAKDKAFFYGAFNPTYQNLNRRTLEIIRDAQGIDHTLERDRKIYNYAANAKWFVTPQHTLSFSAFGDPSTGDMGAQRESSLTSVDPSYRFSEIKYGGHNLIGRWNGELLNNWFVEGSVGYHKDKFEEELERNLPGGSDRRVTPFQTLGGVGFYGNSESRNTQYRLKFSNFLEAAGEHNFRYGVEYQDIGYDNTSNYSGPAGAIVLPDGRVATSGFTYQIRATQFRVPRVRFNPLTAETESSYTAFYLSDSWSPIKSLNIMAGFRYERDKLIGQLVTETGTESNDFTWGDNWGPRFAVTWDPTNDDKTKVSFSWGRFFGKIPNDLAVRALSTEVTSFLIYDINDVNVADPQNPVVPGGTEPQAEILLGIEPTVICGQTDVPGISNERIEELCNGKSSKITYQDEWILGAEREVIPFLNVGVKYTQRDLGRTLEDFAIVPYSDLVAGTADFGSYIIGNPDESFPDLFPKPERKYKAFSVQAEKRMHDNWQMLASYTWSELRGNYEGFFRRDNGQSDPFITSLYDFPYLADPDIWQYTIEDGLLPNDRAHVFNLYGSYMWDFGLNLGLGYRVRSGLPLTRLGYNEAYGNGGEIALDTRGSEGRGDTVSNFDLHFDYPLQLGAGKLYLVMDVFNLFNQQNGTEYDLDYETGCAVATGGADCLNPDFGRVIAYQAPRQFRFAARYAF
jgi:outer membrane receptor for ferrienterochelin and colicin